MPRLILLNGPPGCGKSTLAEMFVAEHPLTLNLDIDRVRSLVGRWQTHPHDAGLLARELAVTMARTHLTGGRDVVVPQYVARPEFIERLHHTATGAGADFHEVALMDSRESSIRRFEERTARAESAGHVEAQELLDRAGGVDELGAMYDRLVAVLASRPHVRVLPTESGHVDRAYAALKRTLGR